MFFFLLLMIGILCANAQFQAFENNLLIRQKRIVGGQDGNIKDYPYEVHLESDDQRYCGGTVLSKYYILTAAHCIQNRMIDNLKIRCGSSFNGSGGTVYNALKVIKHPLFCIDKRTNSNFDIGLIKLKEPLNYTNLCKPIQLEDKMFPKNFEPNDTAVISGWGWIVNEEPYDGTLTDVLQVLQMPLISKNTCNKIYEKFGGIYKGQICAGYRNERNKDLCYGDSGSPLVWRGKVIGIAAYIESNCGELDYPSVFTEVAYFLPWIKENAEFDS